VFAKQKKKIRAGICYSCACACACVRVCVCVCVRVRVRVRVQVRVRVRVRGPAAAVPPVESDLPSPLLLSLSRRAMIHGKDDEKRPRRRARMGLYDCGRMRERERERRTEIYRYCFSNCGKHLLNISFTTVSPKET
jgi:hypothetical protein